MANFPMLTFCFAFTSLVLCEGIQLENSMFEKLVSRIENVENMNLALIQRNEILEHKNDMLKEKVANMHVEIESRLGSLEHKIDYSKEESHKIIAGEEHHRQQGQPEFSKINRRFLLASDGAVAFTAGITSMFKDHLNPGQIIKFETAITNIGGSYNTSSGIFVAPMTGIYIFSCSLLDHQARPDGSGVMLHAEIVQGQKVLGRIFAHAESTSYRDQGAQTVFAQVTKGEHVWVRVWDSKDLQVGGQLYSTFSGYLLWPME